MLCLCVFFFSSRRRHTRSLRDWSSDVCSSDLAGGRLTLALGELEEDLLDLVAREAGVHELLLAGGLRLRDGEGLRDRKSTRLNSSHVEISYAVFCLKKKKMILRSVVLNVCI